MQHPVATTKTSEGPPTTLLLQVSKAELVWLKKLRAVAAADVVPHSASALGHAWTTNGDVLESHGLLHSFTASRSSEAWRIAAAAPPPVSSSRRPLFSSRATAEDELVDVGRLGLVRAVPWRDGLPYYYINLDRSVGRRRLQEEQALACGLHARRVPAIEPPLSQKLMREHGSRLMAGPMDDGSDAQHANAIVLSFRAALRRCVADGAPFFILAEDDAMLLLEFHERLAFLWDAAPPAAEGLCLHSSSLALQTQLMRIIDKECGPPPLLHKQWPTYSKGHIWAPHEVICNEPLILLLSHIVAKELLRLLELYLVTYRWSPIDWLLPELINRQGLPIYLANPSAMRLVGAPFASDRHPRSAGTTACWNDEGGCVPPGRGHVDL